MEKLLEESKQQLLKPLGNARRKLLIILNIVYIILVPLYLVSEKISTGNYVNDSILYLVYGTAVLFNLISAIYNFRFFRRSNPGRITPRKQERLDAFFGYASVIPVLFMSFCNMIGLGNPSNDAILTDFALAQSLMIVTVIIIGRKAVIIWFLIVVAVLFWNVSSRGWDFEYHYLTPTEELQYKEALKNNDTWALSRKAELEKAKLNPPKITRYFNVWMVFIIVAFLVAYFFSGITLDVFKIIPSVVNNIEQALASTKRMEAERKANEEKTITLINLAHETKTPLTILNNFVDEYIKKYGRNKEIEIIKWNVQRLTTDIVNFFDIERFNKGFVVYDHHQLTDFSHLLNSKIILFKCIASRKKITIQENIEQDLLVKAHPAAIERIVNNLLENAIKYSPENGNINVALFAGNKYLYFSVSNNGAGIPKEMQNRIWEPYFQLATHRKSNDGMGMGLSIVKQIVEDLQGQIELFSEPEKGTQFKVSLYRHILSPNEGVEVYNPTTEFNLHLDALTISDCLGDPNSPYILIVEDNPIMLSYLSEKLKTNYNVYVASNGLQAVEKLKTLKDLDLIICDVMMPEMNGLEFRKVISENEKYQHIPFIFLTAKSEDKLTGIQLGAIDYVEKPFFIDQLCAKIESVLENFKRQRIAIATKAYKSILAESSQPTTPNNLSTGESFEAKCKRFNLTVREIEIISLIIDGNPYKVIGDRLGISARTVSKHVENMFEKVGATNKVELINKLQ